MPLYFCNAPSGAIADAAKPKIAADITRIHCEVTGAPPLDDKTVMLFGSIRAGRTDAQKAQIVSQMRESVHRHTRHPLEAIEMLTTDVPASWVLEGGEIMPEPGEEAAWLATHHKQPVS